jgi:hypothetical protein
MLTTFINTLMSAEADAVCGAGRLLLIPSIASAGRKRASTAS